MKKELRSYSKGESVARYNGDPMTLTSYRSEKLVQEAIERIPIVYTRVKTTSKSGVKYGVNKRALALSAILNTWLPRSNFIYRINSLLTMGCCKTEIMDLFHRLGLASHPNTIRSQLQSSAEHFNNEIMVWKDAIESTRKQENLYHEVLRTQTGTCSEDTSGMDMCSVDFSCDALQNCKYFDEATSHAKGVYPQMEICMKTLMLRVH